MLSGSSSEQELEEWGLAEAGSSVQVRGAGGYKLSRVAPTGLYILTSLLYVVVHILHSISYNVRCTIQQMKIFIFHGRLCTALNQLLYFEFYVRYNCTLNQVRASGGLSRASLPLDQGLDLLKKLFLNCSHTCK